MIAFFKIFVLFVVLSQFCAGEQTQFTAFCDVVKMIKADAVCEPSCTQGYYVLEGVTALCADKKDITSLKATGLGLKTLPESVNAMKKLQILNVGNNAITSLPVFGSLKALKTVYIFNNQLTTLTGVFPNSTVLEFVSANNNALADLPPEFAKFKKLKNFNFDNNNVTSLPEEYVNFTSLSGVGMANNLLDCTEVKEKFSKTVFATECVQAQQRTENNFPALPTSFSTEPPAEGLDAFEIVSIVLAVVFVICLVVAIVLYVRYRNRGIDA